jgi:hypothetical protein
MQQVLLEDKIGPAQLGWSLESEYITTSALMNTYSFCYGDLALRVDLCEILGSLFCRVRAPPR